MGRYIAATLALLLGGIGAHKFYLGNIRLGLVYAVLFWTGIPLVVGLVECVLYATADSNEWDARFSEGAILGRWSL